jgi:hypothetical protein
MSKVHIAQAVQNIRVEFVRAASQSLPIYLAPLVGAIDGVRRVWNNIHSR